MPSARHIRDSRARVESRSTAITSRIARIPRELRRTGDASLRSTNSASGRPAYPPKPRQTCFDARMRPSLDHPARGSARISSRRPSRCPVRPGYPGPVMEDPTPYRRYGWQSSLPAFTRSQPRVVRFHLERFVSDASPEQIRAWDQSIPWLQRECRELEVRDTAAHEYTAILEYELPRDSRRPDVIVLERGAVAVLELKGALFPTRAALDQALGYARDLSAYHAACAGRRVTPVLLVRGGDATPVLRDGVYVVGREGLDSLLAELSVADQPVIDPRELLAPDAYAPLPTIVQAARELFHRRELPMIKRARAATDPALQYISNLAREAARTKTRYLVLLSGVPGSGKTLVGLRLVHAHWLDDLAVQRANGRPSTPAVYLSGNGPLVQVLQDALKDGGGAGRTFVQAIKNYVEHHGRPGRPVPPGHLIVFDEAQRAHDAERVAPLHGKRSAGHAGRRFPVTTCGRVPHATGRQLCSRRTTNSGSIPRANASQPCSCATCSASSSPLRYRWYIERIRRFRSRPRETSPELEIVRPVTRRVPRFDANTTLSGFSCNRG
jgi:Uncharacterized conserved protein (DUF2075)